jgi:hypothetical protein
MAVRNVTLARIGFEVPKVLEQQLPQLGAEVLRGIARTFYLGVTGPRSPKGSVKTSKHPGKYAASHLMSVGSRKYANLPDQLSFPRLGIAEAQGALDEVTMDQPVYITNAARSDGAKRGYADILEAGRHIDSRGRAAGSTQAPEGIYGPTLRDEVIPASARIIYTAMANVDRMFRN